MQPHYLTPNTICKVCGTPFHTKPHRLRRGWGIYCSVACRTAGKWNSHPVGWEGRKPVADRFWEKVHKSDEPDGCWEWTGCILKDGYGRFGYESRKQTTAHRVAWMLTYGPIPEGMEVCHRCDTRYPPSDRRYRRCCRPDHLFLGTKDDNMADMISKGRHAQGDRSGYRRHKTRYTEGERYHGSKLTDAQAGEIRSRYAAGNISQKALGAEYGVSSGAVSQIVRNRTYKTPRCGSE